MFIDGHLMRISPLHSSDQLFTSWHSILMFSRPSAVNTPRGHEEGELIFGEAVLRRAQGVCFDSVVGDLLQVSENLAIVAKSQIAQVVGVIATEHSVDHGLAILVDHFRSGVLNVDDPISLCELHLSHLPFCTNYRLLARHLKSGEVPQKGHFGHF